jgi:predicted transcriptional regulator
MNMTLTISPMSLRLEPTDREMLRKIAQREKRTAHSIATEAVKTVIRQKERDHAFNQSCIDSYNHFLETGLHVTQNEIDMWVDSLGTDKEITIPTCHR